MGKQFVHSRQFCLLIKLKGGRIPKSALFLIDCLDKVSMGKSVLDIGTGETGILAYYLKARGVRHVVACEKSISALKEASRASDATERISWIVSNVFSHVEKRRFDLITSNPPLMPMPRRGKLHDYGGRDGRDVIVAILHQAPAFLKKKGKLLMLLFDFLGATKRSNESPSLQEIAEQHGWKCRIVARRKRIIRKGGETERNLGWIEKIYPKYKFKSSHGQLYHYMLVVEFIQS